MATKKQTESTEPMKEEPVQAEVQPVKDEWDEMIEMIVPRKPKGDDQQYYVCVNDRRYMIPADGKMQKLPKPVAEVLRDSLEAEVKADDFADSIPKEFT